ncbi:rhamnogalacturonan acetylesterase [Undibacterium amnicola]|uniref:Rhamnogalacturonan acetylesterase n=2 Tax=Undibacterium amnicola TaxID=1834038 RepID=A0ABR6XQB8_9BURK|nr:rhamnogalacturonan acetylesterase [Undibacterium amnicola]
MQTTAANPQLRVILVGDSTMATKSGYGDALCARFKPEVDCVNLARGGRSSGSFRAEGLWNRVQELLTQSASSGITSYVLIQFGHNDQPGKPGRSTDLVTEFPMNMARYVNEVKQWGGVPVLVTPLTRRSFREGVLENNLKPWADAIEKVAQQTQAVLLPLNAESHAAVQAMGEAEADTLAVAPPPPKVEATASSDPNKLEPQGAAKSAFDRTHVGVKGAAYFANMVERQLRQHLAAISVFFKLAGE